MTLTEAFIAELTQESATTRRVIERVPDDKLSWKPHEKSMSLGQLAAHVAALPGRIADVADNLDTQVPNVPLPGDIPVARMLADLEANVAHGVERLRSWGDEGLGVMWRLKRGDQVLLEMPRAAVIRTIMLNHSYHHRGQLSLYLRLLDVPVPAVYGPTADEAPFG